MKWRICANVGMLWIENIHVDASGSGLASLVPGLGWTVREGADYIRLQRTRETRVASRKAKGLTWHR